MDTLPPIAEMQRAYLAKDTAYDGLFIVAVKTTGVFCRPVCPARPPLPQNVEFFRDAPAAAAAGYRACKRCRPLAADASPGWAADLLAELDADPAARVTDAQLQARGIDPATVRRHFLKHYGVTFQAFARSRRLSGAFAAVRAGEGLDAAGLDSGYESASGFRAAFARTFGGPPGAVGGAAGRECVRLGWLPTPLGPVVAGATDAGVCLVEFTDRRAIAAQFAALRRHFAAPLVPGSHTHLDHLRAELAGYFAGTVRRFAVPLVAPGTPFQRRVWDELLAIPYGETRSYEALAAAVGSPRAVRAVGRANGLNRVSVVIPCHRVVAKDGTLGGYGGGLRRKEFLLRLERGRAAPPAAPAGLTEGRRDATAGR